MNLIIPRLAHRSYLFLKATLHGRCTEVSGLHLFVIQVGAITAFYMDTWHAMKILKSSIDTAKVQPVLCAFRKWLPYWCKLFSCIIVALLKQKNIYLLRALRLWKPYLLVLRFYHFLLRQAVCIIGGFQLSLLFASSLYQLGSSFVGDR